LGPSDVSEPPLGCDTNVTIRTITGFPQSPLTNVLRDFVFCFPRSLIVDEVSLPGTPVGIFPQVATTLRTLLQFELNNPTNINDPTSLATFVYVGQSTDGFLALRTLNTTLAQPQPLDLTDGITVFEPALIPQTNPVVSFYQQLPFTIQNL